MSSWPGAMISSASSMVQLRLDLAEFPASAVVLWELVGSEQREAAIALLAALIAQSVVDGVMRDDRVPVRDRGALGGRGD